MLAYCEHFLKSQPRIRCQGGILVGFRFVLSSSNFDVKIYTKKIKLYYKCDLGGIPLDTLAENCHLQYCFGFDNINV